MNKIIAISREFRSGGKELGKRLSDKLGIAFYDNSIITDIAKETGMSEENIKFRNISLCFSIRKIIYNIPFNAS